MRQVLADSLKSPLTPDPDGVTTDFSFSGPYKSGTVSLWRNGRKQDPDLDDGFLELGGATVRLKIPPLSGDVLWGEYEPA